jgi:glycosyltransferase involved in cell wall biosynthesis
LRVLHIITGLERGGAEAALFRLVAHSSHIDHLEHIVVSLSSKGLYGSQLESKGVCLYNLNLAMNLSGFIGIFRLIFILRREKPDVVQTWMYHSDLIGGWLARFSGIERVYWGVVHYNLSKNVTSFSTRIISKLCALSSKVIPKAIITCSLGAIATHRSVGYVDNFNYVPLGFDLSDLYFKNDGRSRIRLKWGLTEEEFIFGCVARWDPQKDHQNLIKAFKIVANAFPDVKCVLIGPNMNSNNKDLVQIINQFYGPKRNLLLAGEEDNISDVMSALDVHVLSSLGEGFPNVVAEAMACESPCIVTDVGDSALIVGDTGWVVPAANHTSLAEVMIKAIEASFNRDSWCDRKMACRLRVSENFSLDKMVGNYLNIWRD